MIFYSIKLGNRRLDWAGTQVDARAATAQQQAQHGPTVEWVTEEVPTDKPGLLAWLKANTLGEKKAKQ